MLIAELGKELGQAEFGDARLSKRLAGNPSIAFGQSGVALGIVGSHIWTPTKLDTDDRSTKDKKRLATPIGAAA